MLDEDSITAPGSTFGPTLTPRLTPRLTLRLTFPSASASPPSSLAAPGVFLGASRAARSTGIARAATDSGQLRQRVLPCGDVLGRFLSGVGQVVIEVEVEVAIIRDSSIASFLEDGSALGLGWGEVGGGGGLRILPSRQWIVEDDFGSGVVGLVTRDVVIAVFVAILTSPASSSASSAWWLVISVCLGGFVDGGFITGGVGSWSQVAVRRNIYGRVAPSCERISCGGCLGICCGVCIGLWFGSTPSSPASSPTSSFATGARLAIIALAGDRLGRSDRFGGRVGVIVIGGWF